MFDVQLVDRIGWTLVHSVWQMAVFACLLLIINRFFLRSANGRYLAGCIAILAMVVAPIFTFCAMSPPVRSGSEVLSESTNAVPSKEFEVGNEPSDSSIKPRERAIDLAASEIGSRSNRKHESVEIGQTTSNVTWQTRVSILFQPAMSPIVVVWFLGVLLLSVRPMLGLRLVGRLRRVGRSDVRDNVVETVRRLCKQMGITKTVEIAQTTCLNVPAVVGNLRPLLLLPATAVTGLTSKQLEAIIAHELAHIRRHDFTVNFLQTIVETLLFYHPAVWWVSHLVRQERENCCDDMAIAICNDRKTYVHALVALDAGRNAVPLPATAASGGSLLKRIRRIVEREPVRSRTALPTGVVLLVAITGILFMAMWQPRIAAQPKNDDAVVEENKNATLPKPVIDRKRNHANPTKKITPGFTLLKAIGDGDLQAVKKLIDDADQKTIPPANRRAHVLWSPNVKVVEYLDKRWNLGISDVQLAVIQGNAKRVKRLIKAMSADERKIHLAELKHLGIVPSLLHLAAMHGHSETIKELARFGAKVDDSFYYMHTPLAIAAERGHVKATEALIGVGANVNLKADYTALMRACVGGHATTVEVLLRHDADPNAARHDGQRALHLAAKQGSVECVKLLLKNGADPKALAYNRDTALNYAELYKHDDIAKILREAVKGVSKKEKQSALDKAPSIVTVIDIKKRGRPGFTVREIPADQTSSPLLYADTLPTWRNHRTDRRPYLTIDADGNIKARPDREDFETHTCKLPPPKLAELKNKIATLVKSYVNEPKKMPALEPPSKYAAPTILNLRLAGKAYSFTWYRDGKNRAIKDLEEFYDELYDFQDAAEMGGYEQIARDQKLVDAELKRLGLHGVLKDVNIGKISISNCDSCHDVSASERGGWRWWSGIRFNRWTVGKMLSATVRQDPGKKPFVETIKLQPIEFADSSPLRGQVFDAYSDKPLKSFRLIAGTRRGSGWDSGVYKHTTVREFSDGKFLYEPKWGENEQFIRIEADGYHPEPLPLKNSTVIVRLRPDPGITATVVDASGRPVEGATCALICPDRLGSLNSGHIVPRFPMGKTLADRWRRPIIDESDKAGHFTLPEDPGVQMVAVAHPKKGFGVRSNRAGDGPLKLEPWCQLSGVITKHGKPLPGIMVKIELTELIERGKDTYHVSRQSHLRNVLKLSTSTKTNRAGKWSASQLPAGRYRITAMDDGDIISESIQTPSSESN